jgi:hypothetical protein
MTARKGGPVSLVLDRNVVLAVASDLTIVLLSPIEESSRNVTEVLVSVAACEQSKP